MKLIVCSSGHVPRMHAAAWLQDTGLEVLVVTHTQEMARNIKKAMPYARIVVTGITGLGRAMLSSSRNFINAEILEPGEWYIGMDDNVKRITGLPFSVQRKGRIDPSAPPHGKFRNWRDAFSQAIPPAKIPDVFHSLAQECERLGTVYGALSAQDNPMFRGAKKWSYCKYCKAKAYVLKNTDGLNWHMGASNDAYMTTRVKAEYGAVVVDNFTHAVVTLYEKGGLGTFEERMPGYRATANELVARYPGLMHIDESKKCFLRFDVHTLSGLAKWRAQHGYDLVR